MPFIEQQLSADGVTTEGRNIVVEAVYEIITNDHVASMTVAAAVPSPQASGYAVGDTFRLNAGTPVQVNGDDFHATGRVTAVDSPDTGNPTGIEIISWGAYTTLPSMSPISSPEGTVLSVPTTTLTGAGNDALIVDITTDTAKWTSNTYVIDSPFTVNEWLCTSVKATNAPLIGMRSELSGADDGVRLQIGSSYSAILPWDNQPGTPPTNIFYMAVPNQDPKIYVSTTERRVNIFVTDGTNKQYGGMGLFIPFTDVDSNYPFPAIIHGNQTSVRAITESYGTSNRGIINPIDFSALGCYQYRDNLSSVWYGITQDNQQGVDVCRAQMWPKQGLWADYSINYAPVPTGSSAPSSEMQPANHLQAGCLFFEDSLYFQADQASAVGPYGPAPLGIGNQLHFTVQAHIISNQPGDAQLIGYIDGFENIHGRGLNAFDEIQNQNGKRFIVFQDTNSTDLTDWVAMEMI